MQGYRYDDGEFRHLLRHRWFPSLSLATSDATAESFTCRIWALRAESKPGVRHLTSKQPLSGLDPSEVGQLAEELVDSREQRQPVAADSLVLVHHQD